MRHKILLGLPGLRFPAGTSASHDGYRQLLRHRRRYDPDGKVRLRLAGIDASELEHPWGQKAKWELLKLCKDQIIIAELEPNISYDRVVAICFLPDGRDLSADIVRVGLALDWPKFSGGKYMRT